MTGRNFRSELNSILDNTATPANENQSASTEKALLLEQSFNVVYRSYLKKPVGNNITYSASLFTHERIIYFNGEIVHTQIVDESFTFIDALFVRLMSEANQTTEDVLKQHLATILDAKSQLSL